MALIHDLLPNVISIAKTAGSFIREERKNFDNNKIEHKKGKNNFVSYVDKEAEKQIVTQLSTLLDDAGFIAEEGTKTEQKEKYNWVIDPLDGTTNFLHNFPTFAVSIALMEGAKVVLGVIYEITKDECFYAIKGEPAFCNEKKISVSNVKNFGDGLYITGFPYVGKEKLNQLLRMMDDFVRNTHGIRRIGSAATDLAYVAAGRAEGFYEYNLNSWDVAAGALIVQQAGGKVTDFQGGDDYIFGNQIIASCGKVHSDFLKKFQHYNW